jgi:peptide/nickel transport system substrate-binding protein
MPLSRILALAAVAVLAGTGCSGSREGGPSRGGTLVAAVRGDVDSWNPYVSEDATSAAALELLYPRLVREDWSAGRATAFEPWLAKSWEQAPDGLSITFRLRPDAVWSTGDPVTCDDVRFTWRAQTSDALAWSGAFFKKRVRAVECPDARTAVFRFESRYADQMLDANDDAIVPASYGAVPLEAWKSTAWERRMVTCGPFRLVSAAPGKDAVLKRDPTWWGAADVPLDEVVLRAYPDATAGFLRFLEGEVDLYPRVPPLRDGEVRKRPGLRLVELPSLAYTYLGWNVLAPDAYAADRKRRACDGESGCEESVEDIVRLQKTHPHPFLSDARVRRALSLAIDRRDLVDGLFAGHAAVGVSPIVSALWAHDAAAALPYDPRAAGALLREAGFEDRDADGVLERNGRPFEVRVLVNADSQPRREALDRVAANLARLGVRLVPDPVPRGEFASRGRLKSFDAIVGGWVAGTRIEPQSILHTRAAVERGNNLTAWSTPASDALLDRAEKAEGRDEAAPLWREWQAMFRDEQPYTILYEERTLVGLGARVGAPDVSALHPFQSLHRMWIEGQQP